MHFYVFMNKYGSMIALKVLNLYITEDMQMTYLSYFVHPIILKSLQIIQIRNIKILNSPMRRKITIHCLFWIFWYQDQRTVLKHLFTTNQLLVGYILTSVVSFTTNIKLRRTLFRTFSIVYDFTWKSFIYRKFEERISFPPNWLTVTLKLFWIKRFGILPPHWLSRKKNCLLPYHVLLIYLLL